MKSCELQKKEPFVFVHPREYTFDIENVTFKLIADKLTEVNPPDASSVDPKHFHHYFEFYYFESGQLSINFENEAIELLPGDIFCIAPRVSHYSQSDDDTKNFVLGFSFKQNKLKTENDLYKEICNFFAYPYIHLHHCEVVSKAVAMLNELGGSLVPISQYKIAQNFYQLIETLFDITSIQPKISLDESLSADGINRICTINRIIHFYHTENITIKDIADTLFLSTKQVSRIINRYYGCTFHQLITSMRMKAAANLLESSTMSISDISSNVGYNSVNTFYSAFIKSFGCLPTEYRAKNSKISG